MKTKTDKTSAQFVATKQTHHKIECDFCGKLNYPSHDNPNLFWGFRDGDTGMFIGHNCKQNFYKAKNAGKYGADHANKISEIPEPVPQDPLTHNSKLSNQGLERLLPTNPTRKKGLSAVLTNKNVATKQREYSFEFMKSKFTHSEPVVVDVDYMRQEIYINWKQPTKRNNIIIPIGPNNFDYIKMQLNNLGFSRADIPEVELDSLDIPVKFIGKFGYNKNGELVEGAIVTIEIITNKIFARAEIGQTTLGWALGTINSSKFTHEGSGGGCHGVFLDARYQFNSQEEAKTASYYHLKRAFEYELKKAPEQAAKAYKKEIDKLNSIIGGSPEPKGFDILSKPEKPTKKVEPKIKSNHSQLRTEMMKFRCSKEFKVLLHEMAALTNDSIADIIHKAVKCFPKTDMRLHTKIDYKRLDEII